MEKDQHIAATKASYKQAINTMGDDAIQTKLQVGLPLDLLKTLGRYQGYIGDFLQYARFLKIILCWEESIVSFWITAVLLAVGLASLLLPWSFILTWSGRLFIWGLFGPHMKIVDLLLRSNSEDDSTIIKAMEKFNQDVVVARAKHQDAVKLKDVKCLAFGDYITLVPSFNLTRHYDHPLASSFARLYQPGNEIKMAPGRIPPQQFYGTMIPRTQPDSVVFEGDQAKLRRLLAAVETTVKAVQEYENCALMKALKLSIDDIDMPPSVGYEIITKECENEDGRCSSRKSTESGCTGHSEALESVFHNALSFELDALKKVESFATAIEEQEDVEIEEQEDFAKEQEGHRKDTPGVAFQEQSPFEEISCDTSQVPMNCLALYNLSLEPTLESDEEGVEVIIHSANEDTSLEVAAMSTITDS